MKWLSLPIQNIKPIPEIRFRLQKRFLKADVLLSYVSEASCVLATAELSATIPIKGFISYKITALSGDGEAFAFSRVTESDATGGHAREIVTNGSKLTIKKTDQNHESRSSSLSIDVRNESPAPILAHLFILPAFQETFAPDVQVYGSHVAVGARIQAIRIERVSTIESIETFSARMIRVDHALSEVEWIKLPWLSKKAIKFDWDTERRSLSAARFFLPVIGEIEIKA